jgi:predicted dithiol-disulfide oxidoreductase (DUF899 family)
MATAVTGKLQDKKVTTPAEWVAARKQLLAKEKELTHLRDEVSRQRRELPWERVEKNYTFDAPGGKRTLAELFEGRSQLVIYHFMLGPDWKEGCPSCSLLADHFDGSIPHLNARDVTLVVVSRAPLEQIQAFQKRMGWKFKWVSSNGTDFNFDYHVSQSEKDKAAGETEYNYTRQQFPADEMPGASVFYKDAAGQVFHTYSTYGRGLDHFIGAYNFLDIAPKGRDEEGLAFSMAWVKHHDKYESNAAVDATKTYQQPEKSRDSCCSDEKH